MCGGISEKGEYKVTSLDVLKRFDSMDNDRRERSRFSFSPRIMEVIRQYR